MVKYYTPELSEFHIGFEYEWCEPEYDGNNVFNRHWVKEIFDFNSIDFFKFDGIYEKRVKYLDKEDIELLGFGDYEPPYEYDHTWTKGKWQIKVWFNQFIKDKQIEPVVRLNHMGTMFFHGHIKNKSELVKLLIQLGIDEES